MPAQPSAAKRFAVCAIILVLIVAGRGHLLAHAMGGRYLWSTLLGDVVALGILIALIKLMDAGLQGLQTAIFRRLITRSPRSQRVAVTAFRMVFLIAVVCPFLLATLQIHPQRISTRGTPADVDLPYQDITFVSRGRTLKGWLIESPQPKGIVLVAHGLNANRENFLYPVELLHALGYTAMIFDFPAHGDSPGRSITLGLMEAQDVRAATHWLRERFPNTPVHALGYSMGASAVLTAAGRKPNLFDKIIVDSTFANIRSVADSSVLKYFGPLKHLIWQSANLWIRVWTGADLNQHQPARFIALLDPAQVLIIHGAADWLIPPSESDVLHRATGGKAAYRRVHGYGHAETIMHPDYATWLDDFYGDALQ